MNGAEQKESPKHGVEPSANPSGAGEAADLVRQIEARAVSERRIQSDRRGSDRQRARMWTAFFFVAALIAVLSVIPQYLVGREGTELEFPPQELIGTWSTNDPRYADRTITITPERLGLGLGTGGQTVHAIIAIRARDGEVRREYEITYAGPEGDEAMDVFVYDDALLQLRNPPDVLWRRVPQRASPAPP